MNGVPQPDREAVLAGLREAIAGVEATSADLMRRPKPVEAEGDRPRRVRNTRTVGYFDLPAEDNWMDRLPIGLGATRGFDRRLAVELAAAGTPFYRVMTSILVTTVPAAVPIIVDWLDHLEERIPGPETEHRRIIRNRLICNLNDSAARGRRAAIDALVAQLRHEPPLGWAVAGQAGFALARVATKKDFALIVELLETLPGDDGKGPLIEYLGKVQTPAARELALSYLDTTWTLFAIRALAKMRAPGVRDRMEPYLTHDSGFIRKEARRALKVLPD